MFSDPTRPWVARAMPNRPGVGFGSFDCCDLGLSASALIVQSVENKGITISARDCIDPRLCDVAVRSGTSNLAPCVKEA